MAARIVKTAQHKENVVYSPMEQYSVVDETEDTEEDTLITPNALSQAKRICCLCSGCCCCSSVALVFFCWWLANVWAAAYLADYGSAVIGSDTYVGRSFVSLFTASLAFHNIEVENPLEIGGCFMTIDEVEANLDGTTFLAEPIRFESLQMRDVYVRIVKPMGQHKSNIHLIIDHLQKVMMHHRVRLDILNTSSYYAKWMEIQAKWGKVHSLLYRRILVDKLSLYNIQADIEMPMLPAGAKAHLVIKEISINDVGAKSNGVHLYELIAIIVERLLMSIAKDAPGQFASEVYSNTMTAFFSLMDNEEWFDNATQDFGQGMQTMRKFVKNATSQIGEGIEDASDKTAIFAERIGKAFGADKDKAEDFADEISDAGEKVGDFFTNIGEQMNKGTKKFEGSTKKIIGDTKHGIHAAATTGDFQNQ